MHVSRAREGGRGSTRRPTSSGSSCRCLLACPCSPRPRAHLSPHTPEVGVYAERAEDCEAEAEGLSASLPLCLSASLPLCLSASLPLCLSASLPLCLCVLSSCCAAGLICVIFVARWGQVLDQRARAEPTARDAPSSRHTQALHPTTGTNTQPSPRPHPDDKATCSQE